MSYTHGTTHYNLPQTVGTDTRDWHDTNEAFADVDAALYGAVQDAETATENIDALDAQINTPTTGIAAQLSGAKSDIIGLAGRLTTAEGTIVQHTSDIAAVKTDAQDMVTAFNEPSATSTHAYGVGDYFIYNNILYRATEMIAISDTIVPNVNCEATNVMVEVDDLNQRVGNVDISDVGSSCTDAIKNLTPTIIDGDFIVETVPTSTYTAVANVTLQPGTYIVIGHVSFSSSFGQAIYLQFGAIDKRYTAISTGDNGGGIEITSMITLDAQRTVQLRVYQSSGSDKTLNDDDCELRAIKLA